MKHIFVIGKKEKHKVEVDRSGWTNKVTVRVDGKIRAKKRLPLRRRTFCRLKVGDKEIHEVELKWSGILPKIKCFVDGKLRSRRPTISSKWEKVCRPALYVLCGILIGLFIADFFPPPISRSLEKSPENHTATTIVYYTNFGKDEHLMTLSIPYENYENYHERPHPYFSIHGLNVAKNYITPDEPIIQEIVSTIKGQTHGEEELANALLDFVQYKHHSLSIRYYKTSEFKYPIETLVEMGGDCDTHTFLYATLLKAAGFKCLIAFTEEPPHTYVGVHLTNPPSHNRQSSCHFLTEQEEKYYIAETTDWGWMVGDVPQRLENQTAHTVLIETVP